MFSQNSKPFLNKEEKPNFIMCYKLLLSLHYFISLSCQTILSPQIKDSMPSWQSKYLPSIWPTLTLPWFPFDHHTHKPCPDTNNYLTENLWENIVLIWPIKF